MTDGHDEPDHPTGGGALNRLRAGVLGANDGIVSTAGLVVGVAAATNERAALLTAGMAGLAAGALSMAGGEYVSVSTQRDTERAMLRREAEELETMPEAELAELTRLYVDKGLPGPLAADVARTLTERDALHAHAEAELGIDPDDLTSPLQAAVASLVSFALGALLPLVAIVAPPPGWRIPVCFASVVVALALTGWVSAALGRAPRRPAVLRNVGIGALAMIVTYGVGSVVGAGT